MKLFPLTDQSSSSIETIILTGATLIIPFVGIGNVGQLAMDLLIETAQAPRIARISEPSLLPCAGGGAYSHVTATSYALELFSLPQTSTYLLQQRSPAAPGRQKEFAESLIAWAKDAGIKQIWVLGSLDATFRRDNQLSGSQLRCFLASTANSTATDACTSSDISPLESEWFEDKPLEERTLPPWPVVSACVREGISCAAILAFVSEGDNVPDAASLAGAAVKMIPHVAAGVDVANGWKQPPSWQYAFSSVMPNPAL